MRFPGTSLNRRYPPFASEKKTGPSPPSKPSALSISSLASGARMASSVGSNLKKLVPAGAWGLAVFAAALGACARDKFPVIASVRTNARHSLENGRLLMLISGRMYKRGCPSRIKFGLLAARSGRGRLRRYRRHRLSRLPDGGYFFGIANIVQRICVQDNKLCRPARLQSSKLLCAAEDLCVRARRGNDCLHRREARLDHQLQFPMLEVTRKPSGYSGIGAESDFYAGIGKRL